MFLNAIPQTLFQFLFQQIYLLLIPLINQCLYLHFILIVLQHLVEELLIFLPLVHIALYHILAISLEMLFNLDELNSFKQKLLFQFLQLFL